MLLQFTAAPSRLTNFSLRSMNMLSIIIWAKLIVLALVGHVSGQWASIPFNPPTVPLADRTPYLNAWITQGPNSLSDGYPSSRVFSVSGISLLSFPHSATRPLPPPTPPPPPWEEPHPDHLRNLLPWKKTDYSETSS